MSCEHAQRLASSMLTCAAAGLICLVAWSFLQVFFPLGPVGQTIYALFGAIVFSGYAHTPAPVHCDSVACGCVCKQTIELLSSSGGLPRWLIFDTHLLIEKFTYDQYIWASVTLYLDILNLFLKILQLLGNNRQ